MPAEPSVFIVKDAAATDTDAHSSEGMGRWVGEPQGQLAGVLLTAGSWRLC